jgi:hypothetical protein
LPHNFLLKHVIEGETQGNIEVTERRGRRRHQLLGDLKEKRRYWKGAPWGTRFGMSYGPGIDYVKSKLPHNQEFIKLCLILCYYRHGNDRHGLQMYEFYLWA